MAKRGDNYVFVLRNLVTGTMQGDQGEGFEAFRSKGHRPQTKNISLDQVSKDGFGFGLYQNTYVHGNAKQYQHAKLRPLKEKEDFH